MNDYIIIAVLGAIVAIDTTTVGQFMISQPLVSSAAAGVLLGEPQSALFIGAVMQLMWLKLIPAGGAIYLNGNLGTLTAVGAFELTQADFPHSQDALLFTSVILGIIASYIFGYITVYHRRINTYFVALAQKALQKRQLSLFQAAHISGALSAGTGGALFLLIFVIISKYTIHNLPALYYVKGEPFFPFGLYALLGVGIGTVFSMVWIKKCWYYPFIGILCGIGILLTL